MASMVWLLLKLSGSTDVETSVDVAACTKRSVTRMALRSSTLRPTRCLIILQLKLVLELVIGMVNFGATLYHLGSGGGFIEPSTTAMDAAESPMEAMKTWMVFHRETIVMQERPTFLSRPPAQLPT